MDRIPLFYGLSSEDLGLIESLIEHETLERDKIVFAQGDPAGKLYILLSGEVEIRFKPHDGEELTVTTIEVGGVFGWSAALGRARYTSCAVCTQDSKLASIRGRKLRRLIQDHPQTGIVILERLAGVIAQRLRRTHQQVIDLLRQGMVN